MVLNSVTDAYVNVSNTPGKEEDMQNWTIRRLAVKLAGPIARILHNGEPLDWDTLKYSAEYHEDFATAKRCCHLSLNIRDDHSENPKVDTMMNQAAQVAIKCVQSHEASIAALAGATANKSSCSRSETMAVIGRTDQKGNPAPPTS
jgi:hypothetical protein